MRALSSTICLSVTALLCAGGAFVACDDSRGGANNPPADLAGADLRNPDDQDSDGVAPSQGDCDDSNSAIGPNSIELPGNGVDDDCDGMTDEVSGPCDATTLGQKDATSLANAIGMCAGRFFVGAEMKGPSDDRARNVVATYGKFTPPEGGAMLLLSTGIAADKSQPGYMRPQDGVVLDQNNEVPNPDLTVPGVAGCGSSQPATVNDYTELSVKLKVPMNVRSLTFQLHFFSAEFPEYVCTAWNDELLVEMESAKNGGAPRNISFDVSMNPITINNSYFSICTNDPVKPQTQHCTKSIDELDGTGYSDVLLGRPIGGSTGWLRTKAPVIPGDDITLRFIIFDQGDHIFDSSALIDGFAWSTEVIDAPVTVP